MPELGPEYASLLEATWSEPDAWDRFRVMADYLHEYGWDALAHAYRWMAHHQRRPHHREYYYGREGRARKVPLAYQWAWYPAHTPEWVAKQKILPGYAMLPKLVYLSMPGPHEHILFSDRSLAVQALAIGLEQLRHAYTIPMEING